MTVQTRDVIFKLDVSDSCNCFHWLKCCFKPVKETDPIFVTPRGEIRRFDFRAPGGTEANFSRTLSNVATVLRERAADQNKMAAISIQVYTQMNIVLDAPEARQLTLSEVRRIEQIALPIIQSEYPGQPMTPKHGGPLVRSPATWDLAAERSEAVQEE